MLYYIDRIDEINSGLIASLLPYLSAERLEYQAGYRFQIDRTQSVLAYILLRIGLFEHYGLRQIPKLAFTECGKPYLSEYDAIHFNLSHCKKGVACALSEAPIGVDIQDYVAFEQGLAQQFMTPQECERAKTDPSGTEFTRIWSLKESVGKCLGSGICYDMTHFEVCEGSKGYVSKSFTFGDYVISVTSKKAVKLVRLHAQELLTKCRALIPRDEA